MEREPMTVGSRGRLYTTSDQREDLGISSTYGYGTGVVVEVMTVDRSVEWGVFARSAVFEQSLGVYGEIRLPQAVRERLDVVVGDAVRVSVETA